MQQPEHIHRFCEVLWKWFEHHKRTLPWRDLSIEDDSQRAYMVMVSEVMLQQTQVERVKIVFKNFLESFPSLKDLAAASNADIILAWRGMGYNSRALRLRDAARTIYTMHQAVFPKEMDQLLRIKGLGPYTAAAIRNFAFNLSTPCIDTNIRRVLHRAFIGAEHTDGSWKKDDKFLLELAGEVLDHAVAVHSSESVIPRDARNWHAALMDFGSLVCTKISPKWDICPLTKHGLMKAAYKVKIDPKKRTAAKRAEPGREVGGRFIPNRIFRGKVVEELRDESGGLPLEEIGRRICIDWNANEHKEWLRGLVTKLVQDKLIVPRQKKFVLSTE